MIKLFKYKLKLFKELVQELPLDHVVYIEGSNIGHIAYHATQSSNNFLRVHVLRIPFDRNKEAEYGEEHTLEDINKSLDMAIEACEMIKEKNPDMEEKLENPIEVKSGGFTIDNNLGALAYGLSHLTEHFGELNQVKRELHSSS